MSGDRNLDSQFSATNFDDGFCVFVEPPDDVGDAQYQFMGDCKRECAQELQDTMLAGVGDILNLIGESSLDLLEVCAPWDAPLTQAVKDAGGRAMAVGIHNGYDLTTNQGFKDVAKLIREYKPRYLHVSPPCDPWTAFSNCNQRTEEQVSRLHERRRISRRLLRNCRRLLEIQVQELNGSVGLIPDMGPHHGGGEHPLHAQSWRVPDMRKMVRLCGERFAVHGCMHGMCSRDTRELVKKPWGWFSTHAGIRKALERKCIHGTGAHRVIQGSITSSTAVYPPLLCRRFAKALMQDVVDLFPIFQSCEVKDSTENNSFDFDPTHAILAEGVAGAEDNINAAPVPDREEQDQPQAPRDDNRESEEDTGNDAAYKQMIRDAHRNLGHPGKESFIRLLKDAGSKPRIIQLAEEFDCPDCLMRGRRSTVRQSVVPKIYEKWQCVSVDSFWWHTPREALKPGEKPQYCIGISMMDEATDFHCAAIIRSGFEKPFRNISGADFKQAFEKTWLQCFPAPSCLRYDEEGFLRKVEVIEWLETFGMKLEPIAGESAWQAGKHSKHLQTLKEQMNLLSMELGSDRDCNQLLALAVSAKNSMHQVRGYSPNQWAFGQSHSRLSSFLQQYQNMPLQSRREDLTFEENLQTEVTAQRLFLKVDAQRRLSRALHSKCRPLKEFQLGELVYYFRRGVKEGSRYGGHWHGPARVLTHEKTSSYETGQHLGSVVWISHAGKILRCSPEQLRPVQHDLRHLDKDINGPRNFFDLLEGIKNQQRYLDLTSDVEAMTRLDTQEPDVPHFRARGKKPLSELRYPDEAFGDTTRERNVDAKRRPEDSVGPSGQEGTSEPRGDSEHVARRPRLDEDGPRGTPQGAPLPGDLQGQELQPLGGKPHQGRRPSLPHHPQVQDLPASSSGSGARGGECPGTSRKRKPSTSPETFEREEGAHQGGVPPSSRTGSHGSVDSNAHSGRREPVSLEPGGEHGERHSEPPQWQRAAAPTHGADGSLHGPDSHGLAVGTTWSVEPGEHELSEGCQNSRESVGVRTTFCCQDTAKTVSGEHVSSDLLKNFTAYVQELDVIQMELVLAPRDVHRQKSAWVINAKVKKGAEVVLRKLLPHEQQQFDEAMKKEIDSFLSSDAVQICSAAGIPEERIMQMRWIYTWKVVTDSAGNETGKRAKARLIIKGFQDPRLLHLPRESPTLSTLGRNMLLTCAARKHFPVASGDIKTAFLQGGKTELQDELYGMPPPEVRTALSMKDNEILRIAKAIYGLLNAPKRWFESLSTFLIDDGWIPHSLDKCLYKRIDENNKVCGYLGFHVDDVLCAGRGVEYERSLERLRQKFTFGSWAEAQKESLMYCGCEITQDSNFAIHVNQERFALSIDEINVSQERRNETYEPVTHSERRLMRQALGALNWRATQSAPWMLATVSHLQGCVEQACVGDLCSVNKLVRLQRKHFNRGLDFVPVTGDATVVTFTDASWATRKDGSSQGGQITLLMQKGVLWGEKTSFCVLNWTSRRLRRVARSSTSAEAQMSANALDNHEFVKLAFVDVECTQKIDLRHTDEYLSSFESTMVCDARNIFDGIVKVETSGLQMEEKRTAIELLAIKERLQQARVTLKWVDGEQEMADGLTKPWKHEPLLRALQQGVWRIVYDPTFQSARRKRAMRLQQNQSDVYWLHTVLSLADDQKKILKP